MESEREKELIVKLKKYVDSEFNKEALDKYIKSLNRNVNKTNKNTFYNQLKQIIKS